MDAIANMLTSIRNAQAVKKESVVVPYSKIKMNLAETINKAGFVGDIGRKGKKIKKYISIVLKYNEDGSPVINEIKRVSKPSCRVYSKADNIHSVQKGHGCQIITTTKGLMTGKEAKKARLGGEVICEIW